jgi:PKD repeat protein
VVRVDNANTATPTSTNISTGLPLAYITCVEVETGNDNHLLVTFSNYGVNSVWESVNGGTSWTSVEGNLPDMPIRWALFNPSNSAQALLATELGVWSTDNLNGASTVWGASNSGLANVRVDMLQLRTSDKLVIAATHGRGLFSSDLFTSPTALFSAESVLGYIGSNINFVSSSYKATSWLWDFGDGQTSTLENPTHVYFSAGRYNITLTINGGAASLTKTSYIHILPNRGIPYAPANGGNFDVNTDDFDNLTTTGTSWQLGNSAVVGKNGTQSGTNAWVTGLTGNYADNSDASVWSPNYNFTIAGTYTVKFYSKFNTETNYDGTRLEYSLDKGISWLPVGTTVAAGWYNFANTAGDASFPVNEAFFTGSSATYVQRTKDISFLAGNQSVAFRLRFKSDGSVNTPGAAFDDFEITGPANNPIPLSLVNFQAYKQNNDVMLNWSTENEINVSRFIIERSGDAQNFVQVATVNAKNGMRNVYSQIDAISRLNPRPSGYLYYRLKMIDRTGSFRYGPVARISPDKSGTIFIGPNPFINTLYVYSTEKVNSIALYDINARLVYRTDHINGNSVSLPVSLPKGQYTAVVTTATAVLKKVLIK